MRANGDLTGFAGHSAEQNLSGLKGFLNIQKQEA